MEATRERSEQNRKGMMLDKSCASGKQIETDTAFLVSTAIKVDVETQTKNKVTLEPLACQQ